MTQAIIGAGSKLKLKNGGSAVEIMEITQVGEIGQTAPEVDATPINATSREYTGGLKEGNNVAITGSWVAGNVQQRALRAAIGSALDFEIEWPDSEGADFTLVINNFARGETTAEGLLTFTLEGRITGDIVWVDAPQGT